MYKCGFSFCPNDTFLFYAWVQGLVGKSCPILPHIADVETLNTMALKAELPITKLSFGALAHCTKDYQLLRAGAALGWHCGPKIIAKERKALSTIAIPGFYTTAHLLLDKLMPGPWQKHFCRYDEVGPLIARGTVDCGLIIHESRFTFHEEGFFEIVDLGELWHEQTGLPLPLGGIAIRRDLINRDEITEALQESLQLSWKDPSLALPYILEHSLVKKKEVVQAHIDLYVTAESLSLSDKGREAIRLLSSNIEI